MKHLVVRWRSLLRPKRFTTIVMMLIIWAGATSALFAGISTEVRSRDYLNGRAQIIANSLPVADIRALNADSQDLTSLSYNRLKDRLQQIRASNRDLSFVYLMAQKNSRIVTLVDSEVANTQGYSAPGQIFREASSGLKNAFTSTETSVEGVHRDRWGTWVSAYSPILDPNTGQVVAVAGINTPATSYYGQILLYAAVPLLLSAIPLAGLLRDMKLQSKQQELVLLKNQFVSIASHELRSPLTGMLWAVQSLSRSGASRLNLEQLSILGAMYHSTESSLRTVNEILDFSIFERGQAKIQRDPTDVTAVIKQVVATLSLSAKEKRLNVEPVGKWPRQVYTDGDVAALKRAFMNIFSNAIKYSNDKGSIEITHQAGTNEHIIGIHDHGIGIPDTEKEKVMSGYYRATNATNVEVHGTGLGLMVTRKIIEQHGGRLWLDSELNQGTTVFIALPAAHTKTTQQAVVATPLAQPGSADSKPQGQDLPLQDTPSPQPPKQS